MKKFFFAVIVALIFVPAASAWTVDSRLSGVASLIARRGPAHPLNVVCVQAGDPNNLSGFALGWTFPADHGEIFLAEGMCEAAESILDPNTTVPPETQTMGILALTHESFHQRLDHSSRLNEGITECNAVRHFTQTVRRIGGTMEQAMTLKLYMIAFHKELISNFPEYNWTLCKLPVGF